jgi:hypothetical protein
MEDLDAEEYKARDRIFYTAMVNAWLNTKLELDKQLLGLSVTAIGLLVTLLRTMGTSSSQQLYLFAGTLFSFLVTVISVFLILGINAQHIEKTVSNNKLQDNKYLEFLDIIAPISFCAGMVLVVIIGINSAVIHNFQGENMSQDPKNKIVNQSLQTIVCNDSWNRVSQLRPQASKAEQVNPSPPPQASSAGASENNQSTGQSTSSNNS